MIYLFSINKGKKESLLVGYDFSEFIHCKFVITHIAPKFLISRITRQYLKLTFSPTFWTFTIDSFAGYENISIIMNINILLWQIGD